MINFFWGLFVCLFWFAVLVVVVVVVVVVFVVVVVGWMQSMYLAAVCMSFAFSAGAYLLLEGPLIALQDICVRGVTRSAH